jgi:hypothetical protein
LVLTALAGLRDALASDRGELWERRTRAEAGTWVAAVTRDGQELRFTQRHGHASLLQ